MALFQDLPPPINPTKNPNSTLEIQVLVVDMGFGQVNSFVDVLLACHQYVYEQQHNRRALEERSAIIRAFLVIQRGVRRYLDSKKVKELVEAAETYQHQAMVVPASSTVSNSDYEAVALWLTRRQTSRSPRNSRGNSPTFRSASTSPTSRPPDSTEDTLNLRSIVEAQQEELTRLRQELESLRSTNRGSRSPGSENQSN